MKAVIQRVLEAQVVVEGQVVSRIGPGLLTLLGVQKGDTLETLQKMIAKILDLRIFADEAGKMNLSLKETGGAHLVVSQFTLAADCSAGRRPSFISAENPAAAKALYERALELSQASGVPTQGGVFQADMKVSLVNDGPVTFTLETGNEK
ncbi:MAG: D-aminoacyl-tRNA deacylase [Bdellovibrionota bacterium]